MGKLKVWFLEVLKIALRIQFYLINFTTSLERGRRGDGYHPSAVLDWGSAFPGDKGVSELQSFLRCAWCCAGGEDRIHTLCHSFCGRKQTLSYPSTIFCVWASVGLGVPGFMGASGRDYRAIA